MMQRDDFEHRLGQGLKRWAGAGQPTLDLEAYVRGQPAAAPRRRPVLVRWLGVVAAAAVLALGLGVTFPSWAGAAASWPLVGPVIREIIMQDAGLAWAYKEGLIQQPLAETTVNGVTVRILGVVADPVRTTIIYQMIGLPAPAPAQPVRADPAGVLRSLARPVESRPYLQVRRLPGVESIFVSHQPPVWTPLGLLGTVGTNPLGAESGTLELGVEVGGQSATLSLPVSRAAAARLSRQVTVGRSQSHGGVTVTVDAVTYTPVETLVQYRVDKAEFDGSYGWNDHLYSNYLESGDARHYGGSSWGAAGAVQEPFPTAATPLRLVIPAQVQGEPADLTWRLETGSTARVGDAVITLTGRERQGDRLGLALTFLQTPRLVGLARFEVVDAGGRSEPIRPSASGWSNREGTVLMTMDLPLPAGFEPVALRARQIGVLVEGPWVFDLPVAP